MAKYKNGATAPEPVVSVEAPVAVVAEAEVPEAESEAASVLAELKTRYGLVQPSKTPRGNGLTDAQRQAKIAQKRAGKVPVVVNVTDETRLTVTIDGHEVANLASATLVTLLRGKHAFLQVIQPTKAKATKWARLAVVERLCGKAAREAVATAIQGLSDEAERENACRTTLTNLDWYSTKLIEAVLTESLDKIKPAAPATTPTEETPAQA